MKACLFGGPLDGHVYEIDELYPSLKTPVHRTESVYQPRLVEPDTPLAINAYVEHTYYLTYTDPDGVAHYHHTKPKHPCLVNGVL